MKRVLLLLIVIMAMGLVACGAEEETSVVPTVAEATQAQTTAQPTIEVTEAATTEAVVEATLAEEATEAITEQPTEVAVVGPISFVLTQETEARFYIEEILFGAPKTVVGTTKDVEGTIVSDFAVPANTTVGTIRIDLSTLQTDSGSRNRQMHQNILQTGNDAYRYAEFVPKSLSGMPASITIGQQFSFQIIGDLTIHGTTLEKTFDVTVTPVSETRLEGLATVHILYSEFGVQILRLPDQVASVEDDVILELAFVAEPG